MNTKTCTKCQAEKSREEFSKHSAYKDGLLSWCKQCIRDYSRALRNDPVKGPKERERCKDRYHDRPLEAWAKQIKHKFGITVAEYRAIEESQAGKCAICGNPPMGRSRTRLSVDHCHKTGKIRGLLCTKCNIGIGHFDDNPETIMAAAIYMELHNQPAPVAA